MIEMDVVAGLIVNPEGRVCKFVVVVELIWIGLAIAGLATLAL
jgi:hypothetical protein